LINNDNNHALQVDSQNMQIAFDSVKSIPIGVPTLTNAKQSMFSDRRRRSDRRTQNLSMPAGLDRRSKSRRNKHFQPQPWWLQIGYASELVSEGDSKDDGSGEEASSENNPFSENSD
jgi:hypothetical protein